MTRGHEKDGAREETIEVRVCKSARRADGSSMCVVMLFAELDVRRRYFPWIFRPAVRIPGRICAVFASELVIYA